MRIGTLKSLCAAAVAVALALPAAAQDAGERTFEAGQRDNAARGAAGEVGTAGQDQGERGGAIRTRPGETVRPGQPATGVVVEQEETLEGEALDDRGTRTANYPPGQEGQVQGRIGDQALVRWIAAGNEAEIRVNEFAQQQAQSDQVKQFAQKMAEEHTKLGEQLREAAQGGEGGEGVQPGDRPRGRRQGDLQRDADEPGAPGAPGRRPGAERQRGEESDAADDNSVSFLQPGRQDAAGAQGRAAAARGAGNPLLALHEEIKRQCAESTIQALREKQGAEFDHAFMHQQVVEHMAMLDTLKVAERHASENLKPTLREAQQHTQQHLDQAKQIVEQLDNERQ